MYIILAFRSYFLSYLEDDPTYSGLIDGYFSPTLIWYPGSPTYLRKHSSFSFLVKECPRCSSVSPRKMLAIRITCCSLKRYTFLYSWHVVPEVFTRWCLCCKPNRSIADEVNKVKYTVVSSWSAVCRTLQIFVVRVMLLALFSIPTVVFHVALRLVVRSATS